MSYSMDRSRGRMNASKIADVVIGKIRYELMRYSGEVQAAAITTAIACFSARRFDHHARVIADLVDVAACEAAGSRPPMIISKPYTNEDAARLIRSTDQSEVAAGLAVALVSDFEAVERLMERGVRANAGLMLVRRLLLSVVRSIPADAFMDGILALDCADLNQPGGEISIAVPLPERIDPMIKRPELTDAWKIAVGKPWSRQAYASLIASVVMTVVERSHVSMEVLAQELSKGGIKEQAKLAIEAGWDRMPDGESTCVLEIVDVAKALSDAICADVGGTERERAAGIAAAVAQMSPVNPAALAGRFRSLAAEVREVLPERLAPGQLVLLLGDAPAVVV